MKPASDEELGDLMEDFFKFCGLGNTELKAAYLAASGRGFVNIIHSTKDAVQLQRETDGKYIICHYPFKLEEIPVVEIRGKRNICFHTDTKIFKRF